jgi:hypothetical protein
MQRKGKERKGENWAISRTTFWESKEKNEKASSSLASKMTLHLFLLLLLFFFGR